VTMDEQASSKEYQRAGVDIDGAKLAVKSIKEMALLTPPARVISGVGGFSGLFRVGDLGFSDLVLAAGADGVGTKVKIAQMLDKHDTVGIDLVAMNVDDVVTSGAMPRFFLDYIAIGSLNQRTIEEIVKGIVCGCRISGCVLLGGETAQMPDLYEPGEYDLAGFCVGATGQHKIVDGRRIGSGDILIGLGSSGLHSNGFTLARKVLLEKAGLRLEQHIPELGRTLGEELLEPTRIYSPFVLGLMENIDVKGLCHITGGGIIENVPRVFPPGLKMRIFRDWPVPPIFQMIERLGSISQEEMYRVFNMGVGMVVIVSEEDAQKVLARARAAGIPGFPVGEVMKDE